MRKYNFIKLLVIAICLPLLNSCEVIGGIFQAGMWVGILVVVVIAVFVIWLIRKMMR